MSFPDKKDERIKKSYLAFLILMSKADNVIQPSEDLLINNVGKKLGLSDLNTEQIKLQPEKYITILPDTLDERIAQFYYLLFLMGIDGKLDKQEVELCKHIGLRLCPNPDLVDDLISIIAEHLNRRIPAEKLIMAVKKYFN